MGYTFGIPLIACVALLILFLSSGTQSQQSNTQSTLERLSSNYKKEGIEGFLQQKEIYRNEISQTLSSETATSERKVEANSAAAYLFPDLLATESMERHIAETEWLPLETEIEKAPGTAQSRQIFEELRANILNYEQARLDDSAIPNSGEEVIRIYDLLSSE